VIEFQEIKELIPISEYGIRYTAPGFAEWYMRRQPTHKKKQYRTAKFKIKDGEIITIGWSEWKDI
jgi:hypothetical protein